MKKSVYLAPYAESMEFAFDEAVLAASEENFSNEQLGTISGKW